MPGISVHRVTKYDPADRDENGWYVGPLDSGCDEGPVEAAYLEVVAAFARAAGVEWLTVRDPELSGVVHFGTGPVLAGHGLRGLFAEPAGFHDGARVDLATAIELVRVMLRESGAWCLLEAEERFFVHVGQDQYLYIGTAGPVGPGVARARELGLFPEPQAGSPYAPRPDGSTPEPPADEGYWARLRLAVAAGEVHLLEERFVANSSRWHRLTPGTVDAVRAGLAPRSRLAARRDPLTADPDAVLGPLDPADCHHVLREYADGRLAACWLDPEDRAESAEALAGVRRLAVLVHDDSDPRFTAVLPDPDGVVRVRGGDA
ncbi:RNA-binding protein [Kitasatospora sp. NPDC056327]|uniref:RNA-binding protein n=1 Tax=Kitasatospora sp. NPDC056327 TaxID=3345785 RepID=UPI0035DFA74B